MLTIVYYIAAFVAYSIGLVVYRLYFHPLARFPGPKLAAATLWYEFYHDVMNPGKFLWKVEELHKRYGPIVRINPMEIHINDPQYFSEIYAGHTRGKTDKFQWWMHVLPRGSTAFTADHDLHRKRRTAIATHFSKRSIQSLEPLIIGKVDLLLNRIKTALETGEIVNLSAAYAALTMDVISRYSFGYSVGNLEKHDFGVEWIDLFHMGMQGHPLGRQVPWLFNFFKNLPPSILTYINPLSKIQVDFETETRKHVRNVLSEYKQTEGDIDYRTIFHDIKDSDLPESEKSEDRLTDEAFIFITAGTETTARTLSVISFHLLDNPRILQKLREELKSVLPELDSVVSSQILENLPYLHAVVSEGLRISHAFVSRLPRIARERELHYQEWTIPKNTPVSESSWFVHMNEDIFPEPFKFRPERWLKDESLSKFLVPWSKGTRNCLGMNLAFTEIYLAIALIHRRFDLELYETIRERDVDISHDFFAGMPKLDSHGIQARIVQVAKI